MGLIRKQWAEFDKGDGPSAHLILSLESACTSSTHIFIHLHLKSKSFQILGLFFQIPLGRFFSSFFLGGIKVKTA